MNQSALPQIGIRFSGGIAPRRCIELAQATEGAGFASVWFAENPFQRGILATAGACAAATSRVWIGVGVVNPYTRHPVQIAMDFAALDELAAGRAILGIGSGVAASIKRMGIANDRPVTAVREAIAVIRPLLAGDSVTYRGRVFAADGARLGFKPHREMPIYMAAAGERALRACGQIADGLIVSNLTPPRSTGRAAAIVAEAAAAAGRPKPAIVQYVPCVARADGEAARQAVKVAIGEMLTSFWPVGDDWPPARETLVAESGIARRDFAAALARLRRGEDAATALDDGFVEAFAIAGTAEDCLDRMRRYGVDELALTFASSQPEQDIAYLGRALAAS